MFRSKKKLIVIINNPPDSDSFRKNSQREKKRKNHTNFVDFAVQDFQFRKSCSPIPFRTVPLKHFDRMSDLASLLNKQEWKIRWRKQRIHT